MKLIKRYPITILTIGTILYLSLFKPPSAPELERIPHIDKIVHFGMYAWFTAVVFFETVRKNKGKKFGLPLYLASVLLPVALSGGIELLQQYATTYRSGDIMDFAANASGSIVSAVVMTLARRKGLF